MALAAPAALGHRATATDAASTGNAALGYKVFQTYSCGACHSMHAAGPTASGQLGLNFNRVRVPYPVAVDVISGGSPGGYPLFPTLMVGYQKAMTAMQLRAVAAFVADYSGGYKTCADCTATERTTK
jgi:mono/diheme cytochrome c family protein